MADLTQADADGLARLKAGYDAGYYRTESAEGEQTPFPWAGKTCKDCPFWKNSMCQVFAEYRSSLAHTCVYFDEPNHAVARELIAKGKGAAAAERDWPWNR